MELPDLEERPNLLKVENELEFKNRLIGLLENRKVGKFTNNLIIVLKYQIDLFSDEKIFFNDAEISVL